MLLKTKILVLVVTSVVSMALKGQPINDLRNRVYQIIASKNATVAVSIKGVESNDTLSVNGNMPMPMMSVFKLHIALAVLNQVDKSKLQLSQSFFVKKEDLHPGTWSRIMPYLDYNLSFPKPGVPMDMDGGPHGDISTIEVVWREVVRHPY